MKILLCSTSSLKEEAVIDFMKERFPDDSKICIDRFDCDEVGLPPQPYNCAIYCAKERLNYLKYTKKKYRYEYDYYISIENGLNSSETIHDECIVIVEHRNIITTGKTKVEIISDRYQSLIGDLGDLITYNDKIRGYSVTFGKKMYETYGFDPRNWMKETNSYDRKVMIKDALSIAFSDLRFAISNVDKVIRSYKEYSDFPKPGVVFQDIFAVLADPKISQLLTEIMESRYKLDSIDYVVGLESRGFFGVLLAHKLGVGFIPIRKAGKLPGPTESIEYGTEYSKDICEIQTDIPKGSKVLIFDDLIATGGSLRASVDLLEKLECEIVDCCVLREVVTLRDKAKAKLNRNYTVLLS